MLTTPALGALRRHYPDAEISYLAEEPSFPLLVRHPYIDDLIIAGRPRGLTRVRYDWRLGRRLRARHFDLVIDFHGGPRSAWLTLMSGAPQRIGYAAPLRGWIYTTSIPWSRALVPPRHSVERQWDLLRPLGIADPSPARDPITLAEPEDVVTGSVFLRLRDAGFDIGHHRLIVIHVSAGNPFRRWPADRFASLAAALVHENPNVRVVFTSGPSEQDAVEQVSSEAQRLAGERARAILRCGDFGLEELQALIGFASLYIGGDSGPLHVAAATRAPIVALFGPTLAERSMPWRDPARRSIAVDAGALPCRPCHQRHCVPGDFRCLTMISSDQVLRAARTLLDDSRHQLHDDDLSDRNLGA